MKDVNTQSLISSLDAPEAHKSVLVAYFVENRKVKDIAISENLSVPYIYKLINKFKTQFFTHDDYEWGQYRSVNLPISLIPIIQKLHISFGKNDKDFDKGISIFFNSLLTTLDSDSIKPNTPLNAEEVKGFNEAKSILMNK